MKWQEYQEAVGRLYEDMNTMGIVKKNITIPDKITGQPRQIDVWWELIVDNHTLRILIDAKQRSTKIDIKDVEEIVMLAKAVKADKAIIVTNNEWTEPAGVFANFEGLDLRILTISDALDLIVEDKWKMCKWCNDDCLILDKDGFLEIDGLVNWWLAGTCRSCKAIFVHCQGCGDKSFIPVLKEWKCNCSLSWRNKNYELEVNQMPWQHEQLGINPLQIKINFQEY